MTAAASIAKPYTAEDYLALEVESEVRSEFRNGEVDQYRTHVEHYVKQEDNEWLFKDYSGLESSFELTSVEVEIALADLYEAVEFSKA